jgi:hypothetical protein
MLPTRQLSGTTSKLAYLVLLRAEIARFTHTKVARLCCSDPQLMPCGFHWRAVSSCAVLCSPDVPPVLGFPNCTSDGLTGFTFWILRFGSFWLLRPRLRLGCPTAQMSSGGCAASPFILLRETAQSQPRPLGALRCKNQEKLAYRRHKYCAECY